MSVVIMSVGIVGLTDPAPPTITGFDDTFVSNFSCTNNVFCMRSSLSLVTCELGDRQVSESSAQLVAATP